ncbi:winged helix-turn-helix domain-containing protein [Desulfonema magnum]|uniref:HTH domain-containing protein n=1 Tax=Desulfonema magnum TaxID=45655 RepID=A0A975GLV8_9BACT|nr:winged helix-turn-helix domain-containing protein [Desulfonema magnum]QTA85213.1 HTH domain-containing protein [Desulfonema magnum]
MTPPKGGTTNWYVHSWKSPCYPEITRKIAEIIRNYPHITRKEIARLLNISEDGVKYHLKKLGKCGMLTRVGPVKGGDIGKSGRFPHLPSFTGQEINDP